MGQEEQTYPLRVAVRRTGLSAERLRAWEARYGVVRPIRTPGGSRRYRETDLDRLRLLREAVEAGHRIGDVAGLEVEVLRAFLAAGPTGPTRPTAPAAFEALIGWLERLEVDRVRACFDSELARRGVLEFARAFALPLLVEVGRRWEAGQLSVAAEHLASNLLVAMFGEALRAVRPKDPGAVLVFATPEGERHALGLFVAALTAAHAGAATVFLGAEVPEDDLVASVTRCRADALVLGLVAGDGTQLEPRIRRLRTRLPERAALWLGGPGVPSTLPMRGVERVANLDQLASWVALLQPACDGMAS
ncbi:MAG: MerR family transcriptional regulator [Myxococcota bacterium]